MAQKDALVEELKASQEKSLSQASALHAKELEKLQTQVDKLNQELSSSKEKTEQLEKTVSELQPYKEKSQVTTPIKEKSLYYHVLYVLLITVYTCLE